MKKTLFTLVIIAVQIVQAQTPLATVSIESTGLVCTPGQCTNLTATYFNGKATNTYEVSSIAYAPTFPFTTRRKWHFLLESLHWEWSD